MTVSLYKPDRIGTNRYRDPGTDICLNCPLDQVYLSTNGNFYETCEQCSWYARRKDEPKCLIALARFYGVELDDAEKIAKRVGLHPDKKITAWRYAQELREITQKKNERS